MELFFFVSSNIRIFGSILQQLLVLYIKELGVRSSLGGWIGILLSILISADFYWCRSHFHSTKCMLDFACIHYSFTGDIGGYIMCPIFELIEIDIVSAPFISWYSGFENQFVRACLRGTTIWDDDGTIKYEFLISIVKQL